MADRFEIPRYCGRCGEIFDGRATTCPECGGIWPEELPRDLIAVYALLLTEIHNLRRNGAISEATFAQMRRVYEERLLAVRPARRRAPEPEPVAPLAIAVPAPDAAVVPVSDVPAPPVAPAPPPFRPPRPAAPPKPPGHVRLDLRNWAARRQADLVLYLGAFLLSISALIFVSYTGSGGGAKSALFGLYTLLFLVLGIQLRKWERVQEAGPVFLGLGAVLVPLNFVAIYTNVLRHEDVSREYVWLAGSLSTAWLYSLLAWRDFGRFYWLPAAGAYLAAYASLGACLHFASEWYGPWFVALGAAGVAAAPRLPVPPRARGFVEGGSYALVSAALLYTHQAVAFEEGAHAAIPVAYAFTAAAIARSAFPSRRPIFLGLLPPVSVMTLSSAGWAIDPWAETVVTWSPVSLLAVAAGYLAVGRFQPRYGPAWRSLALAFGIVALVLAHGRAAEGDSRWLLPVAYALSSLIAAGWYGAGRYVPALAFLPPLLAAAAASTFWAADALAYEWLGTFAVFAAVGYALIARRRPAEAEVWGMLAASSGATAIAISHAATAFSGINRWELPAVYGLAAGGAAFDAFRFRPSALLGAFALAIGGAAALWAFEVDRAYWAFPAIGISLVILASERAWVRDAGLATLAWPGALILAATPVLLVDAYTDEAWVGAAAFAAAAIAIFGLALRTNGAFAALAGHTSDRASRIEQQMLARVGAWALFASGGMVDVALELSAIESAWTFAIAGIALWLAVAGLGKWLRSLDEVLGPVGLSAFALAVLLGHEGPGHVSMMLGLGAVAASLGVRGRFAMAWRAAYAGGASLALLFAHIHAAEAGADAWQLPAAYALTIVALLWDGAWNRYQPAMLFVPAVATVGAGTAVWWRGWPDQHMAWTPLAFALGIAATERLWMRGSVLRPAAWPYVLALALAPLTLTSSYEAAPWYGVAGFALAGMAWFATVVRSNGALRIGARFGLTRERQVLAFGGFSLSLATVGYLVFALEQPRTTSAWAFAGLTITAWAVAGGLRRRLPAFEEVIGPASLTGIIVAVFAAAPHEDHTSMLLGLTAVAAALAVGGRFPMPWRIVYGGAAAGSIVFAHNHAELAGTGAWQLPAAYGLVLIALLWDSAWNRWQPAMLCVPAAAAATATAFAWWREWPLYHMAWAPLAIALAIAASERLWSRGDLVRRGAWWYVLGLSLAPLAALEEYESEAWAGAVAFVLSALAWAIGSWRSKGSLGELFDLKASVPPRTERHGVALGAFGLAMISLGFFNRTIELSLAAAGWTYAATGAAAIFATCRTHVRVRDWLGPLTVAGLTAFVIGADAAGHHTGELSAMFGVAAAAFVASGLANRSDNRVIGGFVSAVASAALAWAWQDWPAWSLSLVYGATAAILFFALAPSRKEPGVVPRAVTFLSVAPVLLAIAGSVFALSALNGTTPFDGSPGSSGDPLVRTPEWLSAVINIAIAGAMLVFEGMYRKGRLAVVAGGAVLLLSLEMAIATFEFENIQVYTAPVAICLIGLGLSIRRSEPLLGHHMLLHEGLFILGAAVLVLPPAEQSFEPGGANWGLLVILEGMALLAVGLTLFQRWLAVAGVVTLVAVAARYVVDNTANGNIPYWAMLGVAGLLLLGVGVLMLLEREWWDRTKARMARWWLEQEDSGPGDEPPDAEPAPQP